MKSAQGQKDGAMNPESQFGDFGRYRIVRLLGIGGMGMVFLAEEKPSGQRVAIKALRPELVKVPAATHRFWREAGHMRRLAHPHVLPILEVSEGEQGPYLVMPFMERGSLAQVLAGMRGGPGERRGEGQQASRSAGGPCQRERRDEVSGLTSAATRFKARVSDGRVSGTNLPLVPEFILKVARQIAAALSAAHKKGVIHQDLKPANILLDDEGNAWLTDFGMARTLFNDSVLPLQQGQVVGTGPYLSPAMAAGEAEDTRADIYASGALLYEMLTGQPPYHGSSPTDIVKEILAGPPRPIRELNPQAPDGLIKIAEGAMARRLSERYASMAEFEADLERVARGAAPALAAAQTRRRQLRKTVRIAALASVVFVATLSWRYLTTLPGANQYPGGRPVSGTASADALTADGFRILRTIFDEEFNAPRIDERLWEWNHIEESARPGKGKFHYQASQLAGSLLLESGTESEDGWYAHQAVWLDTKADLKQGDHVVVEFELSASAQNASVQLLLSGKDTPFAPSGENMVALWTASGTKNHPLSIERQRLRIELSAVSQRAWVYGLNGGQRRTRWADISSLNGWRLHLVALAVSAEGLPADATRLRLHHARALIVSPPTRISGVVRDANSELPVAAINIKSSVGLEDATSNEAGWYRLRVAPGANALEVFAQDYEPVGLPLSLRIEADGEHVVDFRVKKTRVGYGDVVETVRPGLGWPQATQFAVAPTCIWHLASRTHHEFWLCRYDRQAGVTRQVAPIADLPGLVLAGHTLYGVGTSTNRGLYRINEEGRTTWLFDLPTPWPQSLAWDGRNFWIVELTSQDNRYGLYELDGQTGQVRAHIVSSDIQLVGLTYGADRLWASTLDGVVYEVDPEQARQTGRLDPAVLRKFKGPFVRLCFAEGTLWGLTVVDQVRIHRLNLTE
ncbi:MAG: protein kinase [Verrucomicrobia bacterium]|nr:protein kinase [Verrucomicrobiota bacterium]